MLLLAYYLHNLDPIIIKLGFFSPRWYGFAYLLGFACAYLLVKKLARDGMLRVPMERVPDLVLNCCIFGVLIGGRVGFCLFYDLPRALINHSTPLLWSFNENFPFWGVLRVNDGGMSAHGGIVFTILAVLYFAWRHKLSFANIADAAAMVVPVGLCFGRIANFINGELYGHVTDVPWAVQFPSEIYAPTNGIPTVDPGLVDKLRLSVAHMFGIPFEKLSDFQLATLVQKHDAAGVYVTEQLRMMLPARHPSQLYEALLEGVLLWAIVWTVGRLWRKDGMAAGAFLVFYPIMRIAGEQFRVGDTPLNIFGIEISKGVLYSLIMLIPAGAYWLYWIRRNRRFEWVGSVATKPPAVSK